MKLKTIAIASGLLFFIALPWQPYPFSFVLKPFGVLALALIAATSGKPLGRGLALGLTLGALGDILLDLEFFLPGLTAFAASHLVYIALFIKAFRQAGQRRKNAAPWLLALAGASAALLMVLLPGLGDMALPVLIYMTIITLMAAFSFITPFNSLRVAFGATLFVISDATIGMTRFIFDFAGSEQLIWATYFAAQYLITTGFLAGWETRARDERSHQAGA